MGPCLSSSVDPLLGSVVRVLPRRAEHVRDPVHQGARQIGHWISAETAAAAYPLGGRAAL